MKKVRIVYYLLMAVWLFGGMLYGLRTFYIALIAQIFVLLCCAGLNVWTFFSFTYKQELDRRSAVKGETVHLRLSIHNDKPFPFTMMRVFVQTLDLRSQVMREFNLAPRSDISFDLEIELPYRGEYPVGIAVVEIHDLFDLVPMRFKMRMLSYYKPEKVLVYPRLIRLPILRAPSRDAKLLAGRQIDSNSEHDAYSHTREYRPGDSARFIHWKQSLRQQALFTRQYDLPVESTCYLCLDNARDTVPDDGEQALLYADTVCELAAAVAWHALARGHQVQVLDCCPRRSPMLCRGPGDFGTVYEWLARLDFHEDGVLHTQMQKELDPRKNIGALYVITRRVTDELCSILQKACRFGLRVTLVMTEEGVPASLSGGAHVLTVHSAEDFAGQMTTRGLV